MKYSLPCLLSMLCASSLALAEPPNAEATKAQQAATSLVRKKLVRPLAKRTSKRKMFSRVAPVPTERRVRVLDATPQADARGRRFVRFAVDTRRGWDDEGRWKQGAIVGCVYPDSGQVFVQEGDEFHPARSALGKDTKPRAVVCRPAADPSQLALN